MFNRLSVLRSGSPSSVCVSSSVWILIHIVLAPGARLVAPAVGAAYIAKWSNIALQAPQMGVIR